MRDRPDNEAGKTPQRKQFSTAQKPLPAAPPVGLRRIEFLAMRFPQVPLHEQADAFRASSTGSEGIHAVAAREHKFEAVGGRAIHDATTNAVEPVAGLGLAGQIINEGAGHVRVEIPALAFVERHQIARVEQHKLARADFLVIIAGQRQGKFRHQRQKSAEPVGAEPVGVHARSDGQARGKILLALRQRVGQRGLGPKQVRAGFHFTIAAETVGARVGAEFTLIPRGQFHRQRREQRRLDAAPAQACAHAEFAVVGRQLKCGGGVVVALEHGIMRRAAHNQVQRNFVGGIEQMIDARRNFPAVAGEGFGLNEFAAADFIVAVGKSAARHAKGEIRVGSETMDEAEFGIQIHRRERQPQREVRAQEIRPVVVIKSVAGKRRVSLHRLVVAELDQVALDGVNLRRREHWEQQRHCGQK